MGFGGFLGSWGVFLGFSGKLGFGEGFLGGILCVATRNLLLKSIFPEILFAKTLPFRFSLIIFQEKCLFFLNLLLLK